MADKRSSISDSLRRIPLLGRALRIIKGIARLPHHIDRLGAVEAHVVSLDHAADSAKDSIAQIVQHRLPEVEKHLAGLDRAHGETFNVAHRASEGFERSLAVFDRYLPEILNVIASNHAVARSAQREQEQLKRDVNATSEGHRETQRKLAAIEMALQESKTTAEAPAALLARVNEDLERVANESRLARQSDIGPLDTAVKALTQNHSRIEERLSTGLDRGLSDLGASIQDLYKRVEFVRQETLFEVLYGKRAAPAEEARAPVITNLEKVHSFRNGALRVNLGCGHLPLNDYLNVDRRELPGIDIVADVGNLPFEEGEVDEIFSAHLLEHFPLEQLKRSLLPYWQRLLKPGGAFRAVVPDHETMLREYASGTYPFEDLRLVTYGAQDYAGDFHFNMFTPDTLSRLLEETGFKGVEIVDKGRRNGSCFEFEVAAAR